jgi:sulfite exporter TauE/SafE
MDDFLVLFGIALIVVICLTILAVLALPVLIILRYRKAKAKGALPWALGFWISIGLMVAVNGFLLQSRRDDTQEFLLIAATIILLLVAIICVTAGLIKSGAVLKAYRMQDDSTGMQLKTQSSARIAAGIVQIILGLVLMSVGGAVSGSNWIWSVPWGLCCSFLARPG